jgi:putative flippase GtrA
MNRLQQEIKKLSLFSLSGVLNTLIGYALIFSFMFLGLTPLLSNVLGYSIGFFLSFFMGKYVVFRSQEKKHFSELIRYLIVFALAYLINALTLRYFLKLGISPYLGQLFGGVAFSTTTYTLSRIWVFNTIRNK